MRPSFCKGRIALCRMLFFSLVSHLGEKDKLILCIEGLGHPSGLVTRSYHNILEQFSMLVLLSLSSFDLKHSHPLDVNYLLICKLPDITRHHYQHMYCLCTVVLEQL